MKIITQIREYRPNATMGQLFIGDSHFCFTLEDIGRPNNVKFPGDTCVPEGCYLAEVSFSNRFQRDMILLRSYGEQGIIRDGVEFNGVRVHKGNKVSDTEGCILVGANTNDENAIWNCSKVDKKLLNLVKSEKECLWVITSK